MLQVRFARCLRLIVHRPHPGTASMPWPPWKCCRPVAPSVFWFACASARGAEGRGRGGRVEKLARALERARALSFIKLGQVLSTRADLLGEQLAAKDLSDLQDRLPPFDGQAAARGKRPSDRAGAGHRSCPDRGPVQLSSKARSGRRRIRTVELLRPPRSSPRCTAGRIDPVEGQRPRGRRQGAAARGSSTAFDPRPGAVGYWVARSGRSAPSPSCAGASSRCEVVRLFEDTVKLRDGPAHGGGGGLRAAPRTSPTTRSYLRAGRSTGSAPRAGC